ncbi:hypothetical protein FGIG_09661 [Fasciola gigantica]|uniref:Uncharacterized protein n=1 Tax=Fasciola gigantica TaxID=46835 RepID=A0A504YVX7_FASGI|nr:hypothetical protein FGIG_09661 [Fasciola gigantica]
MVESAHDLIDYPDWTNEASFRIIVQPGVWYHLFPKFGHDNTMDGLLSPKISRMLLEYVILRNEVRL